MTTNRNAALLERGGVQRQNEHVDNGAAPRAMQGLTVEGRPSQCALDAVPPHRSHSAVLIAIAALIARGGRP
jgi:hypothetical protein